METKINWATAKKLVTSGELTAIGSNLGQINPSGEYYLSADKNRLYKKRNSAPRFIADVIAKKINL